MIMNYTKINFLLISNQSRTCCRSASSLVTSLKPGPRNKLVRVRFAPSPTGFLHLGGLRTALYNFLFAKSQGGQFVLRIEDTDQTRLVPGAIQQLEDDLHWAGVIPDESVSKEGSYGPYIQSQRLHLYQGQAQILLDRGAAYRCFCTERRLELLRKEALRQRQVPRYDNRCRHLTSEEIKEKMKKDTPHCIRFKLTPMTEAVPDLVYGSIDYDPASQEGDPVILKMDGFPTYHLANVVDDHMMVMTHVLRGVEWQVSTPKHVLLYKAFGWTVPKYAHLPLIMNSDGTKLSKRQGDIQIKSYKEDGIFPIALLNFITKAGGGFTSNSLDELYSMDELIKNFDLTKIHTSSCRLTDRLLEYNRMELRRQFANEEVMENMIKEVSNIVHSAFKNKASKNNLHLQPQHIRKVLLWSQSRINRISDLVKPDLAFLWVVPSEETLKNTTTSPDALGSTWELLSVVKAEHFEKENLKVLLPEIASKIKIPFKEFMKVMRTTISGLKEGPGVAEMMEILGPEATLLRIKNAENIIRNFNSS